MQYFISKHYSIHCSHFGSKMFFVLSINAKAYTCDCILFKGVVSELWKLECLNETDEEEYLIREEYFWLEKIID